MAGQFGQNEFNSTRYLVPVGFGLSRADLAFDKAVDSRHRVDCDLQAGSDLEKKQWQTLTASHRGAHTHTRADVRSERDKQGKINLIDGSAVGTAYSVAENTVLPLLPLPTTNLSPTLANPLAFSSFLPHSLTQPSRLGPSVSPRNRPNRRTPGVVCHASQNACRISQWEKSILNKVQVAAWPRIGSSPRRRNWWTSSQSTEQRRVRHII